MLHKKARLLKGAGAYGQGGLVLNFKLIFQICEFWKCCQKQIKGIYIVISHLLLFVRLLLYCRLQAAFTQSLIFWNIADLWVCEKRKTSKINTDVGSVTAEQTLVYKYTWDLSQVCNRIITNLAACMKNVWRNNLTILVDIVLICRRMRIVTS